MQSKPPAKTTAQRKAEERARHKAAGRVPLLVYVHPQDRALVRAIIEQFQLDRARRQSGDVESDSTDDDNGA